jgi:hypothetical protein
MSAARSRTRAAAARITLARSCGPTLRQTSKPRAAAASASSRSSGSATGTVPISSSVAGLSTGSVRPPLAGRQRPSTWSSTSWSMPPIMPTYRKVLRKSPGGPPGSWRWTSSTW